MAFYNKKHKILTGDMVQIITGKDKGKVGKVIKLIKEQKTIKIAVEGCCLVSKTTKRTAEQEGGIIKKERLIDISNVAFYDSENNQFSKIGYKEVDGKKCRYTKKSDRLVLRGS